MTNLPTDNIHMMFCDEVSVDNVSLTVEEVEGVLRENRERFDAFLCEIQAVSDLFSEDSNIMPIQCREAIKSLTRAQRSTRSLHDLLDKPDHLPIIFTALRYRLIFQVHLIEKKAEQLICFIESYRAVCINSTGLLPRRKQIYRALKSLSDAIADISEQTSFVKHEACFHQKRLAGSDDRSTKTSGSLKEPDNNKENVLCLLVQQN